MKILKLILAAALSMMAVSCVLDPVPGTEDQTKKMGIEDAFSKAIPTGYSYFATVTVPAATNTLYIEYQDANGKTTTVPQAVTPKIQPAKDGKDVEPFGTVDLLLKSKVPAKVKRIYYIPGEAATKASGEVEIPVVEGVFIDSAISGQFGKQRYIIMPWAFGWIDGSTKRYPADVVVYDEEHNHTLVYKFVYNGGVVPMAYVLEDAYVIEDHVAVDYKYSYCSGCVGCQMCMPWGCSCGCGSVNNAFVPNGNLVDQAVAGGAVEEPAVDEDAVEIELGEGDFPEPKTYVTTDGDFTNYHSSGVVMFDDKWPKMPDAKNGKYNLDFNDVVVDYDIEAVTVSNDRLATEGWREQVKVVLHVRALGGDDIWRVGVALENFNTDYVQSVSEYMTLDSWQNPHGDLPAWARAINFTENSIHYDALSGSQFTRNTNRPSIEIGQLQAYNGKKWNQAAGKDVYLHKDDHGNVTEHVMNPALRLWSGWPEPDKSQYDPELENVKEPYTFAQLSSKTFYNTIPGYVNVDGGLYTYTVIYHMKPRAEMEPEESVAAKENMIEAVMNNMAQNFFAVKKDYTPIGLKGYQPLDYQTKDGHVYADEYTTRLNANLDHLNPDVTYVATNGQVWAFKCPVLTRHAWEMTYFANAYPHYHEWAESNGTLSKDWYKKDLNYTYLSCEW